uniref:Uncharacterized protein n=1 Tax=Plectus sambesii TaxID=2011161 RepID=A0A914V8E1_9BILA
MAFLAVERPDSERRKSDGAVSDRKPPMAGRSKRRFSERLKNGWSPRSGKAFAASSNMSPAAAENGDVAKSIIINVPSKAERKQIYSDWTDASSGSANLNVLSTTPHDDQFNELCTTNSLQAVSDVEEIDEGKQTSSSRLSLDDNK